MSKRIKDTEYTFLTATLRAREPRLLGTDKVNRVLEARDFAEAAKVLTDCGYPDMSAMSAEGVEEIIAARRQAVISEIEKYSPEKPLAQAFRLRYDYHNVKTLVKARAAGVSGERLLSASGRVAPKKLVEAFESEDRRGLPPALADAMEAARGVMARTGNPQQADFEVDRAYYAELLSLAAQLSTGFYAGYVRLQIDTSNLRSAVRTLRLGKPPEFLKLALIPGGDVPARELSAAAYDGRLASAFSRCRWLERAAALGEETAKGGPMTGFELECDNAAVAYLKQAKLVSFGPEPAIAFLASLEGEITAVRMLLMGKLTGVPEEIIRERMRECYV